MDGYERDPRGGRGRGDDGRDGVWYVPDAAPQAGMYPGPWGEGRFAFRRSDGRWADEAYVGHDSAEGTMWERGRRNGPASRPYDQRDFGARPDGGRSRGERQGCAADGVCAWQIMTEDPTAVTPATTLADAARVMRELDVGVVPVVDDEEGRRLVGVITDRDMVVRALADGKDGKETVGEHMTAGVSTVAPGDTVHDVLDVMKHERVRRVPVTDPDGRLVGIISQADLAVSYAGLDLEREAEVEEAIERISEPRDWHDRGPRRPFGVRGTQRY